MNDQLQSVVQNIKGRTFQGSSVLDATLYHNLPFPELNKIRSHRKGTAERWDIISSTEIAFKDKTVYDLGCSAGGMSLFAAQLGANVTGFDYDPQSLAVARYAAKELGVSVAFKEKHIDKPFIIGLERPDITLWLSQWMWIVKQTSLDEAKDLLFEISKKSPVLFFESAANDAMAAIKGATQDNIREWLWENTMYSQIKDLGFSPGWNNRHIFLCQIPISVWKGYTATIMRISRNVMRKKFKRGYEWMVKREMGFLEKLKNYDHFPKLIGYGIDYIDISYCGNREKITDEKQCEEILKTLEKCEIISRDINPKNLLTLNNKLFLIDFGWAIWKTEQDTPIKAPAVLGGRYYTGDKTNDRLAMKKTIKES